MHFWIGIVRGERMLSESVSSIEPPLPSRQWSATVIILGWISVAVHPLPFIENDTVVGQAHAGVSVPPTIGCSRLSTESSFGGAEQPAIEIATSAANAFLMMDLSRCGPRGFTRRIFG
jgi:hypothetical protein